MRRSVSRGCETRQNPAETAGQGRSEFEFGPYFRANS
jgi:hypothetical protein